MTVWVASATLLALRSPLAYGLPLQGPFCQSGADVS